MRCETLKGAVARGHLAGGYESEFREENSCKERKYAMS